MKRIILQTLGCKVNQCESSLLKNKLKNFFEFVSPSQKADYYILNTCTITSRTDRKAREYVRKFIKNNPEGKVIITGCLVERDSEQIKKVFPQAVIFNNSQKLKIPEYLIKTSQKITIDEKETSADFLSRSRAYIKIQDGCKEFCSYCIIPYVRPQLYSKDIDEVYTEVEKLVDTGFKEVVLCGINLNYYFQGSLSLAKLIRKLNKINLLKRIRISSLNPLMVDNNIISLFKDLTKLCPHLHISLQSGDEEILKRMNRNYTPQQYRKVIDELRKNVPDIAISTDIIAGFPGEDKKRFLNTYNFIQQIQFSKMHIFRFSPRPQTVGAVLDGQITPRIIKERAKKLELLEKEMRNKYLKNFLGKTVEVLIEKNNYGLTPYYFPVVLNGENIKENTILPVKITEITDDFCRGVVAN